jgi:hypothetical protein
MANITFAAFVAEQTAASSLQGTDAFVITRGGTTLFSGTVTQLAAVLAPLILTAANWQTFVGGLNTDQTAGSVTVWANASVPTIS